MKLLILWNVKSYSDLIAFIAYSQQYHVAFDLAISYIIELRRVKCTRAPVPIIQSKWKESLNKLFSTNNPSIKLGQTIQFFKDNIVPSPPKLLMKAQIVPKQSIQCKLGHSIKWERVSCATHMILLESILDWNLKSLDRRTNFYS